jgi:transcriptional regulator with XRE-family HTH domain
MRLNLKLAIYQAGTTQRRLARDTQIAENRLSQIVQAWVYPRPDEAEAIAKALRASPETLFKS